MAHITMRGPGEAQSLATDLARHIGGSGLSCEQVAGFTRTMGDCVVCAMVFEKYYMRVSNRASLTVVITGSAGQVVVDAVGAGGGQGALLRFSWGAEEDFVGGVEQFLLGRGLR